MVEVVNHKTRKLFRVLARASKNVSERDILREEYGQSMGKMKDMIKSGGIQDKTMLKELDAIEQQIARLVLTERVVARHVYDEKSYSNRLVQNISKLQRDLNKYMKYRQERQKRIDEIEAKIASKEGKKKAEKKKSVKKKSVKKKTTKKK